MDRTPDYFPLCADSLKNNFRDLVGTMPNDRSLLR